ncbi:hypothetical protein SBI_00161 [Streptomyces bingchenggensis BCW-1]|uniref:Uncharacterized protein n=1 Tax=Streptomyces bingchenggensis (strain BCW-1) TaxID=749414 RepID=D7BUU1_STRBB|nr:hypothetical protein SBI_00161 [Streptomyces bingchenggensis BCW-1]
MLGYIAARTEKLVLSANGRPADVPDAPTHPARVAAAVSAEGETVA